MPLHIAKGLTLPDSYVTETTAVLAQRRVGKTYTASVIAEELAKVTAPFVVLDPTGAWWGLRSSADGKRKGLPVVILGGAHGDVPLEPEAGRVIADLVADNPGYYVIDLSGFESRRAEIRFAMDFAERLYRRKANLRDPLHLILDEAEVFVPQRVEGDSARMLGAFEAIVKRGGIRGIGTTIISQRAAAVNKHVLEQVDRLILLRTVGPNDRKAVDAYVSAFASPEQRAELMGSLPSLKLGEAWVYEPGGNVLRRVQVRLRRTFNSSATPKPGETRVEPKVLAPVDLDALRERMAATIEKAKADDPKLLRAEIDRLSRVVREMEADDSPVVVEREVPVVDAPALRAATEAVDRLLVSMAEWHADLEAKVLSFAETYGQALGSTAGKLAVVLEDVGRRYGQQMEFAFERSTTVPPPDAVKFYGPQIPAHAVSGKVENPSHASESDTSPHMVGDAMRLGKAERSILTVLAQFPAGRTRKQLAMQAGYAVKGGGYANALGRLRSNGWINPKGEPIVATPEGVAALGDHVEPLPRGSALVQHWLGQVGKAERSILTALLEAPGNTMERDDLAAAAGYEPKGGGFANALGRLRTLELISRGQPVVLDATLAEAGRGLVLAQL